MVDFLETVLTRRGVQGIPNTRTVLLNTVNWHVVAHVAILLALVCSQVTTASADDESEYYQIITIAASESPTGSRSANWKPAPNDLALEVSGLEVIDDNRVAVAIRKGEIWILENVYANPPTDVKYHRFATSLHEPLGLLKHNDAFYTAQRSELTRIADTNDDGTADEYLTVAKGWGVTGHYHEYAYGPKLDKDDNLWVTLNIGMGLTGEHHKRTIENNSLGYRQGRWRGWGMKVTPAGDLIPVCAGMRSPSGIGTNAEGDMFYTDQQGNWVATNSLHHMREGAFFHHAEALASMDEAGATIQGVTNVPNGLPYPDAVKHFPQLCPPAVWFPYKKAGQSATDVMLDESDGNFGPFAGQLFVGEFTQASIHRVFLEKVDGQYQGACFPFRSRLASAVLRMDQGTDGSMFVGLTNRGWSSLGNASYGLQRLRWTGRTPFEVKEVHALPDGFELTFTQPIDRSSAEDISSYQLNSHTYLYHSTYGSDEIQKRSLKVRTATVADDLKSVRLAVDGLRELFVHEIIASGVKNSEGKSLLHPHAWYTLNKVPK